MASPIAKVTEFTDGDHTRHLPSLLANTISEVAPDLLLLLSKLLGALEYVLHVALEAAGFLSIEKASRLLQSLLRGAGISGRLL